MYSWSSLIFTNYFFYFHTFALRSMDFFQELRFLKIGMSFSSGSVNVLCSNPAIAELFQTKISNFYRINPEV